MAERHLPVDGTDAAPTWWELFQLARAVGGPEALAGDPGDAERTLAALLDRIRPLMEAAGLEGSPRPDPFRDAPPAPPQGQPLPLPVGGRAPSRGGRLVTHRGLVIDLDRVLPD
ncbi:MAG TPA: hypothetical protein VNO34_09705 [Actinomycetota bacterium]|nr:hypothetical protein [Actinomycetota bacterium]